MRVSFILSRYLTHTFLSWCGIFILSVMAIVVLFDATELLRQAATKSTISISDIMLMVILKLPHLIQILLPFIVLFASMTALWQLNRRSEIIIFRASGVSVWQFLAPIVISALLIGIFDLTIVNPLASSMMERYRSMKNELLHGSHGGISIAETGIWLREVREDSTIVYRVGHVDQSEGVIRDVSLLLYGLDDKLLSRIDAVEGYFHPSGLALKNSWIMPVNSEPVYNTMLVHPSTLTMSKLLETDVPPETLSFWQLPSYITLLSRSGLSTVKYDLYWQSLLSRAMWLGAMVLLAAICALRTTRQGGTVLLIALGALLGFILYCVRDIAFAMGQATTLPVMLAAWVPMGLTAIFGAGALLYFEDG